MKYKFTPQAQKRLWNLFGIFCLASGVLTLGIFIFNDSLVYFLSPTEVLTQDRNFHKKIRVGGLVCPHSIKMVGDQIHFSITDGAHILPVAYKGILPSLFAENKGVIVEGQLQNGLFEAKQLLAKHDETYKPMAFKKPLEAIAKF
jgi:cytochrome c-type biogenesis protein CcmE